MTPTRFSRHLLALTAIPLLASCASHAPIETCPTLECTVEEQGASDDGQAPELRNVILVIGDGMGPGQVALLEEYMRRAPQGPQTASSFQRISDLGEVGLSMTGPVDSLVVDSACSATQLATGEAALSEVIGMAPDAYPAETVLELAHSLGRSTGLVSDTRMTHATPASFAAHQMHRSMESEIAEDLAASSVDVMLSGGLRHWLPASLKTDEEAANTWQSVNGVPFAVTSKRADERDLIQEVREQGRQVVFDRHALQAHQEGPLLGLFASSGMMDGIEAEQARLDEERNEPTLAEMSSEALRLLNQDPDGFFLMVEAGQIDWAGHINDAGWLLHEMLKLEQTLRVLIDFAEANPDTLLVVTADHETGGFGFSYSRADIPEARQLESEGQSQTYAPNFNFGSFGTLDALERQSMSFQRLLSSYDRGELQNAGQMMALVNEHTPFDIDETQATRVLERETNTYQVEGHKYLSADTFPAVEDFEAFYVYGDDTRGPLIAREQSTQSNIVWSTGTHTHTPVPVFSMGPGNIEDHFGGFMHHTEIGQLLKAAVRGELD